MSSTQRLCKRVCACMRFRDCQISHFPFVPSSPFFYFLSFPCVSRPRSPVRDSDCLDAHTTPRAFLLDILFLAVIPTSLLCLTTRNNGFRKHDGFQLVLNNSFTLSPLALLQERQGTGGRAGLGLLARCLLPAFIVRSVRWGDVFTIR